MNPPSFTARIVKIGILRSVIVPPKIVKALGGATHIPVLATYAGETTRTTLAPAGGAKRRLILQMPLLRPAQLDTGARIRISLEPAPESPPHPLPPDLTRALQFRPTAAAELTRASPSTRRIILERLEQSRTPETRQRRLELLIERLAEMAAARPKKTAPNVTRPKSRNRPRSK